MGASQVPTTSAGLSDNWELISSVTPSGNPTSIAFSSISGYKKLMLRFTTLETQSGNNSTFTMRFNSDSGSNYDYSLDGQSSSSFVARTFNGTTSLGFYASGYQVNGFMTVTNTDTTGVKMVEGAFSSVTNTAVTSSQATYKGQYLASASVSTVTLLSSLALLNSGTVALYGVRV